jgi:tetratricopeptide (TPR) repeat protein
MLRWRFFVLISLLILINFNSSCIDQPKETSPFSEILSQPPYNRITDSLKKNPSDAAKYYRRGLLLQNNNYQDAALADFQKAWSVSPQEEYGVAVSNILLQKLPDSAIRFLKSALQKIPSSLFFKLNLADAYVNQNKLDAAIKIINDLLETEPGLINAWLMKSELLEKTNNKTEALKALEKAYQLAPFDVDLSYDLAYKYAENKNPKALALSDSLLKMDTSGRHAEPYYFKGIYFSNSGDQEKAFHFFDMAIQHDYYLVNAYLEKGRILYEKRKFYEALKVFQLAATIKPTFADAYYWMGKCQEKLNQKEDARLNYQRAYGLDKTLTEAKEAADKLEN